MAVVVCVGCDQHEDSVFFCESELVLHLVLQKVLITSLPRVRPKLTIMTSKAWVMLWYGTGL